MKSFLLLLIKLQKVLVYCANFVSMFLVLREEKGKKERKMNQNDNNIKIYIKKKPV